MKWGEDQLNAVKGRELRQSGIWSVYKGSEVEWGLGLGEICVIEYCVVWFTHCLVHLAISNTDSSTSGSTHVWFLIVYNMCSRIFFL